MQVYGLITDGERFLIPKKAEKNDLWQGEQKLAIVVNQAGQYALFGGKLENNEDAKKCITREIKEEAGVDIIDISNNNKKGGVEARFSDPVTKNGYAYYVITVDEDRFNDLKEQIEDNIEKVNNARNSGGGDYGQLAIRDGEMQSIHVAENLDELVSKYLNNELQPVKNKAIEVEWKDSKNKYKHAIDWYKTIAEEVKKNIQLIKNVQENIQSTVLKKICKMKCTGFTSKYKQQKKEAKGGKSSQMIR
ncbi:hypothetical protein MIDIC_250017 [Alphaproteobacteria bacterium]